MRLRPPADSRPPRGSTGHPPPCHARSVTVDELASAVCVDPADVRVILTWFDDEERISDDHVPTPVATAVHRVLNPNSERTVLELYYKGLDPDTGTGATKMR